MPALDARLEPAGEQQDDQNQHHQAHAAAWSVTPAAAMRPRRNGTDQNEDRENDQNRDHEFPSASLPVASGLAGR